MERTPTKNNTPSTQLQHYGSDPMLNAYSDTSNSDNSAHIAKRVKRKFDICPVDQNTKLDELKSLILESNKQHESKYKSLSAAIDTLITQNTEIQKSVEFMSQKYDEVLCQLDTLQHVNKQNQAHITLLESKIDILERNSKTSSLEIRNIPKSDNEKKETLLNLIANVGSVLEQDINHSDIRDVFRMKTKEGSIGPIVVDFTTIAKKENLITACRKFNKINKDRPLNTSNIHCPGPSRPIYLQESLTKKAAHLHYLAREFKKAHQYHGCWTSYGKIYLRKRDGAPALRIDSEEDLNKLK